MRSWLASKGVRRTEPEFELREALGRAGCALCRLALQTAARQLDILSYEAVNDLEVRAHLRAARGFCNRHAWQLLEETRDPLGTALVYKDVVNTLLGLLASAGPGPALRLGRRVWRGLLGGRHSAEQHLSLAGRLTARAECPICAAQRETEETYLALLARRLPEPSFLTAWRSSEGLCWPHLLSALERVEAEPALQALVEPRSAGAEPDGLSSPARLAREYGHLQADRSALPASLVVDLQRRRLEAVARPGAPADLACPVCRSVAPAVDEPPASRLRLADLCAGHAWRLLPRAGPALDEGLRALRREREAALRATVERLLEERSGRPVPGRLGARRLGQQIASQRAEPRCPLCAEQAERDARAISALLERYDRGEAAEPPGSLCLGHLAACCRRPVASETWEAIVHAQTGAWRELSAELAEYVRKHDYRFRGEGRGPEQASPWRAVEQIAGPRR